MKKVSEAIPEANEEDEEDDKSYTGHEESDFFYALRAGNMETIREVRGVDGDVVRGRKGESCSNPNLA